MWYFYFLAFSLPNVLRTTTPCTFATSQLQKVLQTRQFLTLLASKCASRHNGVHFFITSTSKSGPKLVCFVHFHFEMCFAPQRRAIFRHLNFQKWSASAVFCTFWLGNVLRAAMACTFCDISTSKSAQSLPRHSGVHFFISHLPRWLRTRRFSEPTFHPPEPQIILEKHSVSPFFYLLAHLHIFFLLTLSLL